MSHLLPPTEPALAGEPSLLETTSDLALQAATKAVADAQAEVRACEITVADVARKKVRWANALKRAEEIYACGGNLLPGGAGNVATLKDHLHLIELRLAHAEVALSEAQIGLGAAQTELDALNHDRRVEALRQVSSLEEYRARSQAAVAQILAGERLLRAGCAALDTEFEGANTAAKELRALGVDCPDLGGYHRWQALVSARCNADPGVMTSFVSAVPNGILSNSPYGYTTSTLCNPLAVLAPKPAANTDADACVALERSRTWQEYLQWFEAREAQRKAFLLQELASQPKIHCERVTPDCTEINRLANERNAQIDRESAERRKFEQEHRCHTYGAAWLDGTAPA